MSKAFERLDWFQGNDCKGVIVRTICAVRNDYHKDELPTIPANTEIRIDFGGDFGFYGVADINGVLHNVKVFLQDLHNIDCQPYI